MARIVVVSGNDASGKSTFGEALALALQSPFIPEPFETNPFGSRYLQDPKRWAYHAEVEFIRQRVSAAAEVAATSATPFIVMDRSPAEDVHVFASMWLARGVIGRDEVESLRQLEELLKTSMPPIAAYVYLTCSIDETMRRLARRSAVPQDGDLRKLTIMRQEYYNLWTDSLVGVPVIRFDTTGIEVIRYKELANDIASDLTL